MNFVGVSLVKETMVRWQTMQGKMELFMNGCLRERPSVKKMSSGHFQRRSQEARWQIMQGKWSYL
jgi:hypothetical protein